MAIVPKEYMQIPPDHREQLDVMGEARVRQLCSGDVYGNNNVGMPDSSFKISALTWLAERDEARQLRDEARQAEQIRFQTEQTQLSKSTHWAAWIAAAAGIVSVLGMGYTIYIQKIEAAHNMMIRKSIGEFIKRGDAIMNDFVQNKWPVIEENDWTGEVKAFLRTNLNDSYVARFEDGSGIQPVTIKNLGVDAQHDNEYISVYDKVARLQEFSHELAPKN